MRAAIASYYQNRKVWRQQPGKKQEPSPMDIDALDKKGKNGGGKGKDQGKKRRRRCPEQGREAEGDPDLQLLPEGRTPEGRLPLRQVQGGDKCQAATSARQRQVQGGDRCMAATCPRRQQVQGGDVSKAATSCGWRRVQGSDKSKAAKKRIVTTDA